MIEGEHIQAGTRQGGFTLTELIVAMAIALILLLVILGVMGTGGSGYSHAMRRIDANVEARAALTTLADDVAGVRFDTNFEVEVGDGAGGSSELSMLVLKPRNAQDSDKSAGDLCFVHYYTAVTRELEEDTGPFSRKLYRRLVSSADVMQTLKDGKDFASPVADPGRREDEPVAFNVVQFRVEPMVRQEGGGDKPWKKEDGRPDYLDVSLRVTDNETAGLLTAEADWEGGGGVAERLLGEAGSSREGKRVRAFQVVVPSHGGDHG